MLSNHLYYLHEELGISLFKYLNSQCTTSISVDFLSLANLLTIGQVWTSVQLIRKRKHIVD